MPLFDMKCSECGFEEEILLRMIAHIQNYQHHCLRCGGLAKKLIGRSNFKLKGGGWASDLYSSQPSKPHVDTKI